MLFQVQLSELARNFETQKLPHQTSKICLANTPMNHADKH